jgi:hypothetical protein
MPRKSTAAGKSYRKAEFTPIDIRRKFRSRIGRLAVQDRKRLAGALAQFPVGKQTSWGIPFIMGSARSDKRAIILTKGDEASLTVGCKADYLCLLHMIIQLPSDKAVYIEGTPLGAYELQYADGSSHVQPVRSRLEVERPDVKAAPQLAKYFYMPEGLDPAGPPPEMTPALRRQWRKLGGRVPWGQQQYGQHVFVDWPLVYALKNPRPEKPIRRLVVHGLEKPLLLVAGLTAYCGTANPLRHLMRRMYRVRRAGKPVDVTKLELDLGSVAYTQHAVRARGKGWTNSPYKGVVGTAAYNRPLDEPGKGPEDIFSIHGARDATVSVTLDERGTSVPLSLGEAFDKGVSRRGNVELQRLGGVKQWVEVEIVDGGTGQPTPARIHISGAGGEYLAPHGHHEQINANWFEDYGADVALAGRNFAYVQGRFTTDLPAGDLYIELSKGFEYVPTRTKVTLRPGQKKVRLRINRWKDLRSRGWVTADTHVHFISPRTAWLQGQCEGVNVINLLASQWGRLFTNVGDITGRVGVVEDDTIVWVGTENRNHMLGHISLLGTKGLPVYPLCAGGPMEAYVGDAEVRTMSEWAMECRARDGVVIRPHFPEIGFTEDPMLIALGLVDAVEIRLRAYQTFPVQEWYRYLNAGYRVAVAGGTDKMSAKTAVGSLRTYARLDPNRPFTFEEWGRAMRAGRTFATTGPIIDMTVEGRPIGDTLHLPAGGGTLQVAAVAESAWPLGKIELVLNGEVVASESARRGAKKIAISAKVPADRSGWIAARCGGWNGAPGGEYMAAHTSPVYVTVGRRRAFDGPALEHMLNATRGGIEYFKEMAIEFSPRDMKRMIRLYRKVERHFHDRLHEAEHRMGGHGHAHPHAR